MVNDHTFQSGLEAEARGDYEQAFHCFRRCLITGQSDAGDVLFHCGWCLEQHCRGSKKVAAMLYLRAGYLAETPVCRINGMFRAGWILMHEKDLARAATVFRCAVQESLLAECRSDLSENAVFWYAVSLEGLGQHLEALQWHQYVQGISPQLAPESRWREIQCLTQIGSFRQALAACDFFERGVPTGFLRKRFEELRALAERERGLLQKCLTEGITSSPIEATLP